MPTPVTDNATDTEIQSATVAPPVSPEPTEAPGRSARAHQAMNDLLRSPRGRVPVASLAPPTASPEDTTADDDAEPPTDPEPTPKPEATEETFTLTKGELDRRIQAETDRRETVRKQREARDARKAKLRDDPLGASQEVLQELEQEDSGGSEQAKILQATQGVVETYDHMVLDPLFQELPATAQTKLLSDHAHLQGFEQRAALTKAALAQITKNARAQGAKDAETKIRANPALLKQYLAEQRDERDEPEVIAPARPNRPIDMNSLILGATRRR